LLLMPDGARRIEARTRGSSTPQRPRCLRRIWFACLWGESPPFAVQAGVPRTIEVSFDGADRCGTPTTIATMAAVVEGGIQVASRQTWSLHYVFAP
jgi:hypothetical protein